MTLKNALSQLLILLLCGWPISIARGQSVSAAAGASVRLPGEFEPVKLLLVAWQGYFFRTFIAQIVAAASAETKVLVLVGQDASLPEAARALEAAGAKMSNVALQEVAQDGIWIRDYGPQVVREGSGRRVVHATTYDGLSEEEDRPRDEALAEKLAEQWNLPFIRLRVTNDGGNIQSDGIGDCIATEWLIERNAAAGFSESEIRSEMRRGYGCENLVVIPTIDGEGTGHVDMIASITGPKQVLLGRYDPSEDARNAERLDQAAKMLEARGFQVRRVPMPKHEPIQWTHGIPIPAVMPSYLNAIAVNRAVLVPVYSQDRTREKEALDAFQAAYPDRKIVPIDASEAIRNFGAVHCATLSVSAD